MSKSTKRAPSATKPSALHPYATVLASVAEAAWQHRDSLVGGVRHLWNFLSGGPAKTKGSHGGRHVAARPRSGQDASAVMQSFGSVAENISIETPVFWHENSLPKHTDFGDGVRIVGRQQFDLGKVTNAATTFFNSGQAYVQLSPDAIGSRLALLARCYNRYVFRHVRLIYVPRVANTFVGGAVLAYVQDGAFTNFATPTYATAQQIDPCVLFPMRESALLEMNYGGDQCWFCEIDGADSAALRATVQGDFLAYVDDTVWTTGTVGNIFIEYVCDLYQPVTDLGFTVSLHSAADRDAVKRFLLELHEQKPPGAKLRSMTAQDALIQQFAGVDSTEQSPPALAHRSFSVSPPYSARR